MSAAKVGGIFLLFIAFQFSMADEVTKMLQNGENGYNGCTDSYTYSLFPDKNHGSDEKFFTYNCPS